MTGLHSPLGYLALMTVAAVVGTMILRGSSHFRTLVDGSQGRLAPLDGLRGFLAFGVFVHHFVISHEYVCSGAWEMPGNALYAFLGRGFVQLFFMISGFLFWSRAIDRKLTAKRLLISRFWRIMPLYWATSLLVVLTVLVASGLRIRSEPVVLFREIVSWACGGALGQGSFNGVYTTPFNAGVIWSLQYEWWFYFALPLLGVFAGPRRFVVLLAGYLALRWAAPRWIPEAQPAIATCAGFAGGMATAHLVRLERFRNWMRTPVAGGLAVLILLGGLVVYQVRQKYSVSASIALPLFAVVACGNPVFGLLTRRWALFLGHISYSLYLIHGLVLYYLVQLVWSREALTRMPLWLYWLYGFGVTCCVIAASTLTYRYIESPFLARASLRAPRAEGGDPPAHGG